MLCNHSQHSRSDKNEYSLHFHLVPYILPLCWMLDSFGEMKAKLSFWDFSRKPADHPESRGGAAR